MQTNGYDCGVWVLAAIAATLRGFHVPGFPEGDISKIRSALYKGILAQPIHTRVRHT